MSAWAGVPSAAPRLTGHTCSVEKRGLDAQAADVGSSAGSSQTACPE